MGEHYKVEMMATRASTIRRDYQCLTIEIGTDLSQAATALQSHVPPNAKVFLITDAPVDDVATIRAVLPTPENIIDEVKVDSVDVTELTAYTALQNLPDAQPVTPTAADSHLQRMEYASTTTQDQVVAGQPSRRYDDDWRTEASDMVNAYEAAVADLQAGAPSDTAFRAGLGDLDHHDPRERSGYASPSIPSSPFDQQRVSQAFAYLVLGQPSRPTFARQYASPSGASGPLQRPAPAGNPTLVLSEALGLDQDLCESLKWQEMAKAQDLALLANLVTRALEGTKNRNLKPMLQRLVQDMAAKPKLAERVFIVLLGANESCDDRVSLALSKAQEGMARAAGLGRRPE